MTQEYPKNQEMQLTYSEALQKAQEGWLIARRAWRNEYVFLAVSGNFIAYDRTTGGLEPFLVMKMSQGTNVSWHPSQTDTLAKDWAAITRQSADRSPSALNDQDPDIIDVTPER